MEKRRIITAVIALPVFLLLVFLGGWWLAGLLIILGVIGCIEYHRIVSKIKTLQPFMWYLCGFVYIVAGFLAFYGVRYESGAAWLLIIIWSTDTAAYEFGRRIGHTKLAPNISPNKTVEGALCGTAVGLVMGTAFALIFHKATFIPAVMISLLISCIGQIGDLIESKAKRYAGVKDSGNLLPGHGGILDRFDSILLSSIFMYLFLIWMK